MFGTIVGIGILGATTIGGSLLERRFAEDGKTREAELIGDGLFHGVRVIGIGVILYSAIKIVGWFL